MPVTPVRPQRGRFVDAGGRDVLLRGVNLGGDCKLPYPRGGTHHPSDFSDHRAVSFVGRPFPLDEAEQHLRRLRTWGFNCLRLLTTWEAVEHAGPGQYDEDYLTYFTEIVRRAGEHGLYVFVDFHQDVWSRMTGGDGAPGWALEAVGLDVRAFHAAGAAHVMQWTYDYTAPEARQPAYPQMSWSTNYGLPANGIMWTLFWAGRRLTPEFMIAGQNVQDFLRGAYLGSVNQVAARLAGLDNVVGFDTLNEPGLGWLGLPLRNRRVEPDQIGLPAPRPGPALSPLDSLLVARGIPVTTHQFKRGADGVTLVGEVAVNPAGVSIWRPGRDCPFEAAGLYRLEGRSAIVEDDDAFVRIDVTREVFGPFFHEVAEVIRRHDPSWAVFAEMDPSGIAAGRRFPSDMPKGWVNATHWYDARTLFTKTFRPPDESPTATRARFVEALSFRLALVGDAEPAPGLIGEFGIPFDLDEGAAYAQWARGDRIPEIWSVHETALSLMYEALDELRLSATIWNYTASNRNDLKIGDGWNQEDLSIYSQDQVERRDDPAGGARALRGFCRPYPQAVQGQLISFRFDRANRRLSLEYDADPAIVAPTELFLPSVYFDEVECDLSGPATQISREADRQRLVLTSLEAGRVSVSVWPSVSTTNTARRPQRQ